METRANFILVGFFSLIIMAGVLLVILVLSKTPANQRSEEYVVSFTQSVSGLSIGNPVLFNGIQVGQVKDIRISRTEPGTVRVRISVRAGTPVRENSTASLEMLGLTGASSVAISGGTADSPLVVLDEGETGSIESAASPLTSVMQEAPNTLVLINETLSHIKKITGDETQQEVATILASVAEVTSMLAEEKETIRNVIQGSSQTVAHLKDLSKSAQHTVRKLDGFVEGLGTDTGKNIATVLPELRILIYESRLFVQNMTRMTQRIENDPRQFFFGSPIKEYSPK